MLSDFKIISGYQEDGLLREEFHRLTRATFGFDLEEWYKAGYWDNHYIPFSMLYGGKIISNVSISTFDLVIDGNQRSALQLGTVMTHPDHRGKGLASKLIDHILEQYHSKTDAIFLLSNLKSEGFYSQLGFKRIPETSFIAAPIQQPKAEKDWVNLDFSKPETRKLVQERARNRAPLSNKFGHLDCDHLFLFHCLYDYPSGIYLDPLTDALVICKLAGRNLHIYDIVGNPMPDAGKILAGCPFSGVEKLIFHFTPDLLNLPDVQTKPWGKDILFWLGSKNQPTPPFCRPKTMEA